MSAEKDFDQIMADLAQQFLRELAGHETELQAAWAEYRQGHGQGALERIKARAHRLSGLGGTFGHPLLSDLGEAVELAAEAGGGEGFAEKVEALLTAIAEARG